MTNCNDNKSHKPLNYYGKKCYQIIEACIQPIVEPQQIPNYADENIEPISQRDFRE